MTRAAITALATIVVVAVLVITVAGTYEVSEREQVVVTRFSQPVRVVIGERVGDFETLSKQVLAAGPKGLRVAKGAGLYFKMPFVDVAERMPSTLVEYDAEAEYIVTRDKKQLSIDNFARWRIENPLLFRLSVRNVMGAQGRLDDIIYSIVREELGKNNLVEIIRTTKVFTDFDPADADDPEKAKDSLMQEPLEHGREEIMNTVTKRVNQVTRDQFGIAVVDVRIKRAELLPENLQAVFARMRAERERISKGYISEGDRQASVIRGETDRDVKIVTAKAKEQAQRTMGEGDAESAKTIAEGFNKNTEFYRFIRGLEVLSEDTPQGTELVVGMDSTVYKLLNGK